MPKTPQNHYAPIPLSGAFAYVVKVLSYLQTYRDTFDWGAIPIVCIMPDLTHA
jgi:hypothetical protein